MTESKSKDETAKELADTLGVEAFILVSIPKGTSLECIFYCTDSENALLLNMGLDLSKRAIVDKFSRNINGTKE